MRGKWRNDSPDTQIWLEDKLKTYRVKLGYRVLHKTYNEVNTQFLEQLWCLKTTPTVQSCV